MDKITSAYVPIDLLWSKLGNKYEGLVKMINEAKQVVEITGDSPNAAIYKAVDRLLLAETAKEELAAKEILDKAAAIVQEPVKEIVKEPVKEILKEPLKGNVKESTK